MRIIVFFDLPTVTERERQEYRKFRKFLINEGFVMMQQSVYSKIALNNTAMEGVKQKLQKFKPPAGLVQVLTITEKQFSSIEYLQGENTTSFIQNMDRVIIL